MKTTLSDIARKTGYSLTTISRVLNGKSAEYRISKEAADQIVAEARKCNYVIKSTAQILRQNNTKTIGVILPSVTNPFFAELAGTIVDEVKRRGYIAILSVTMESEVEQESCLSALLSRNVAGIIAAPCGNNQSIFHSVNSDMVPVVLIDRFFLDSTLSYVTSNNHKGAVDATNILINNGHRRIACIQGDVDSIPNQRRVSGYMQAMKNAGLEKNIRVVGDSFSIQGGYMETCLLAGDERNRPTAIFALSYTIVLGVMKALDEMGLKIGEDMAVISFDDNMSLDYMQPPITRVAQPTEEMGRFAVKVLFEHIENSDANITQIKLTTRILNGNSISAAR